MLRHMNCTFFSLNDYTELSWAPMRLLLFILSNLLPTKISYFYTNNKKYSSAKIKRKREKYNKQCIFSLSGMLHKDMLAWYKTCNDFSALWQCLVCVLIFPVSFSFFSHLTAAYPTQSLTPLLRCDPAVHTIHHPATFSLTELLFLRCVTSWKQIHFSDHQFIIWNGESHSSCESSHVLVTCTVYFVYPA